MKLRYISLAVLMATLLLVLMPSPASAVSTDIQCVSAPGVDLWISDYPQVEYSEIVLLINYQDSPVVLQLRDADGSNVSTYTLAPGSSSIYELVYPNLGQYSIVVGDLSAALIELPRERPSVYLPPPRDEGSWTWTPPGSSDPKIYSAAEMADMIADTISRITMEVWILTFITAIGGFVLGAAIKKKTLFLLPMDIFSIGIFAIVGTDLLFNWTRLGIGLYYIPLIAGYLLGFFVAHVIYVMVQQDDLGNKTSVKKPVVLYSPSQEIGYCIQEQNNKALVKRLLGHHHRLGTDAGLAPDWSDSTKYPYFPWFRRQLIMIEDSVTEYEDEPFLRWFTVRTYTTYWRLSNASKFPKAQWKKTSSAIIWARDTIDRIYADLVTERQKSAMLATQVAAEMHTYTINRSSHRAIYDQFSGTVPPLTVPETRENVMRAATQTLAAPQKGLSPDTEPEPDKGQDDGGYEDEPERTETKDKTKSENRRKK